MRPAPPRAGHGQGAATPATPRHHGAGEDHGCQLPSLTPHQELPWVPEQAARPGSGPPLGPCISGMGKAAPHPWSGLTRG